MCRCVWSRNLKNEEAMSRVGGGATEKKNVFFSKWYLERKSENKTLDKKKA